ncbi:leucine-rich repeat domain-containing protein [Flavobacterium sp. LM4]|uniref:leucine-rich repeat domain-containing protein n=1 Tax=Flavobacterium sp. LM4 TaxID=1938609 RepID=UPI000993F185|nr:hypothetical protein [Flavobacterium sp. LM4]OOV19128.1 hypothetical protein BXU10_05505 [Flavobacterium sp. LM4]
MAKQIFKTHLNFQEVDPGTIEDKVLVRDSDGNVKEIASTELGGGIEIKGEYNNNGEALAAGLVPGDLYRLPITSDSQASLVAMTILLPSAAMRLLFTNIDTTCLNNGIADKESISDWNAFFETRSSLTFDRVTVTGNEAVFNVSEVPFSNLKLASLGIAEFSLTDFSDKTLYELDLGFNVLTSFDPSEALPAMSILQLTYNPIGNFDPSIALPNLFNLNLSGCGISDFNPSLPLPNSLYYLYLGENGMTNFDPSIALPPNLNTLWLAFNDLTGFDPSIALPNSISQLVLAINKLTTFTPSLPLPANLYALSLNNNKLTEFDPPTALPSNVESLHLSNNNLTVFDPAIALPDNLVLIDLRINKLTDFNPSIALPSNLQTLNLDSNDLTAFDPELELPTALTHLNLEGNNLTVFDPAVSLSNIQQLRLRVNPLTYFNPSSNLDALTLLTLDGCGINTVGWNLVDWTDSVPNNGVVYAMYNLDTITGSDTEASLLAKSWSINA